ncbi:MAG: alkane 1-monooxygenase [Bacteroidetes bacterium]|nr:alkane 1-monooxygenase [Bacteroidota bacterium]
MVLSVLRPIRYFLVFSVPALAGWSFFQAGILTLIPVFYAFGFIPLIELGMKPDTTNHRPDDEPLLTGRKLYTWALYLVVPVQVGLMILFLYQITQADSALSWIGHTLSMGLLCGIFGINVAHELGHRTRVFDQVMAGILLATSLYMHFTLEHNRGHHRRVATPADPATARKNETVFRFWIRSVTGNWLSAWNLEKRRLEKSGEPVLSAQNQMIRSLMIQTGLLVMVGAAWGWEGLVGFSVAAFVGILLLETVNYIEHYGLLRRQLPDGNWERVRPVHSWNSDHLPGRLLLFELSRHSDHHYLASRPYQILRHFDESPQLPTGYPGMMLLSLVPPLWFRVMNPLIPEDNQLPVSSSPSA